MRFSTGDPWVSWTLCASIVLFACFNSRNAVASLPSAPAESRCAREHRRLKSTLDAEVEAGRLEVALRSTSDALGLCESELGPRHIATSRVRVERAWVEQKAGRYDAAERNVQLALSVFESELGPFSSEVASALQVMVSIALSSKDYPRARDLALRLVPIRERIGPPDDLIALLGNLGQVYNRLNAKREAVDALSRSLELARKNHPDPSLEVGIALGQLGEVHRLQGNLETAELILRQAIAMLERVAGPENDRVAACVNNLAALYHYGRKDLAKAEPLYRRTLTIYRAHLPTGHVYTAQVLINLGTLLCERGECNEGRPMFEEGVRQMEKVAGRDSAEVRRARQLMDRLAQGGN